MGKRTAKLTVLQMEIASVYTDIAFVENIQGPGLECDQIEDTDLVDTWKQFLNGIPDGGEVTLDVFFDQSTATHKALYNAIGIATATNFRLKWQGSATDQWTLACNVRRFQPSARKNDVLRASITLKVTGTPTLPA